MDYGHEQTDLALKKLERKLSSEYSKAAKTVEGKLTAHLNEFKKLDAEYSKKVADGTMKQSAYTKWRKSAMMTGKKWKDTREVLVSDMTNANKIAIGLINNSTIDAYALNMNYGTYEVESGTNLDTSFTLYDHATVENLMRDDPQMIPKARLDIPKDKLWNRQKLTSAITQGILTGDSIPEIAERLTAVAGMNANAAIRNARTYTTAAENKGRVDSYYRAQGLGIELKQEWMATLDMRTRSSHRHMDGEKAEVGKKFSNGLRFPGDPEGQPWEIYNCRCTLVAAIDGFDDSAEKRFSRLPEEGMTYEEWKNWKDKPEQKDGQKVVDGKDISGTWKRRPDKFDFEIEDVINAQGFDGVPKILKGKAFDDAVKAANGGNGFIAQRAYSAPDTDTLNAYRDQLYNGKWYVDCSVGSSFYGQGMYATADFSGAVTDEMTKASQFYSVRFGGDRPVIVEEFTLAKDAKVIEYEDLYLDFQKYGMDVQKKNTEIRRLEKNNANKALADQLLKNARLDGDDDARKFFYNNLSIESTDWKEMERIYNSLGKDKVNRIDGLVNSYHTMQHGFVDLYIKDKLIYEIEDIGSYATAKGYDMIIANKGVFDSQEVVILNRTKVIFKGD